MTAPRQCNIPQKCLDIEDEDHLLGGLHICERCDGWDPDGLVGWDYLDMRDVSGEPVKTAQVYEAVCHACARELAVRDTQN